MATKYKNLKVNLGNITFDSKKESRRWQELCLLQRAGQITDLQRQVKFVLIPTQYEKFPRYSTKTGKRLKDGIRTLEQELSYVADFVYMQDGKKIVEDVKGYKGGCAYNLFVVKRKLMLERHGIRIKEI